VWDGSTAGLATATVDQKGYLQVSFMVPPAANGVHTVGVTKATGKRQLLAWVSFTLMAASGPAPSPTATPPAATAGPEATTAPAATPTLAPGIAPTAAPTVAPTSAPIASPTPAPTPSAAPTAEPTPSSSGFVTRCGAGLCLNGLPYRFTGFNIYNANSRDNCWYPLGYNDGALDAALTAIGPRQEAFRAWFYQDLATAGGVRDWSAFDHTIAVAKAHNVRIIATLADQWGSCDSGPGSAVFKGDAWYTSAYKSTVDPGATQTYRDWVAEIVARYRNEPTILAWQLMNEAEIKHDITTSCTANGASILRTWAADVSGVVRSIDTNHLISLGTLGGGQCGTQDGDYQYVHDLPTIDLCEYHDYLPEAMPGDQWNGLAHRIAQCAAIGKPIFIGETGQKDMSLADRAALFGIKFSTQFGSGVVGELIWALRTESQGGSSTNNYDMGPSDPTVTLFGAY
jgi:hypothetical protein